MSATTLSETDWEVFAVEILLDLDWQSAPGDAIAPGRGERTSWDDLLIPHRLLDALRRLNPAVPEQYLQQALAAITSPTSQDAITENQRMHACLVDGYRGLTYLDDDGRETTPTIRLLSTDPGQNDWLAARQVTIRRGEFHRRFDIVLYCNGMPVSIVELKRAGSAHADLPAAHAQLQTYLREFPLAFRCCVFTVISDGITAAYGTPFTPFNHFSPWNVDEDGRPVTIGDGAEFDSAMHVALFGLYDQERFLQLTRNFTAFDEGAGGLAKRIAKPHQYFAVTKAVGSTVDAVDSNGKAGVVWHTQGSGKSMEMELYANLVIRHPRLRNPTVVVITDRNELDGQLYQAFDRSQLLPEQPQQIHRRSQLRAELSGRTTGGIYFTTLQKFGRSQAERESGEDHPLLSDRRNIIVVVDEAHRSHYDDLDGYARHLRDALPNATLIAFTGTPISFDDRNTQGVFGDYIDVYDLTRAVADGATVPVYFEPRLIRVRLSEQVTQELLDTAADEATVGLDDFERDKLEQTVAVLNAVYGAPERIDALAEDLVTHWETRRAEMRKFIESPGKGLIVCATREICARLYQAIVRRRPDWHADELDRGRLKVVYSGGPSDPEPIVSHVRRDSENAAIKARLRDPGDELELVLVKDMMLTGYDSPPLHTLYLDRPLQGALLMQTLARVNRTYLGKPDGLLVGYAPVADNLARALAEYTTADREHRPVGRDIDDAIATTAQLLDAIAELLAGHDWRAIARAGGAKGYLAAVTSTVNYVRSPKTPGNNAGYPGNTVRDTAGGGKQTLADRYRQLSAQLARAWALCSGATSLAERQVEARFYEEVRVWMAKYDAEQRRVDGRPVPAEVRRLLAALIEDAATAGGVLDIYAAAGMPRPSLADLSPAFVDRVQHADNPHLAIEALRALVAEESAKATRTNAVRARSFSDRLTELFARYTNSQLTSAEVIAELVKLATEVAAEGNRGARFTPPLNPDELAFYDAVSQNESAVAIQGEGVLAQIARELVTTMQRDVRTDWTVRDDVRAKLRSSIKRLLVKYDYPPDRQPAAIALVMEQMESMAPRYADARR